MAVPLVDRFKSILEKDVGKSIKQPVDFPTSFVDETTKKWTFHQDFLEHQDPEFYKQLIPYYQDLTVDLSVFRARLAKDLAAFDHHRDSLERQTIELKLQAACAVSAILEKLNRDYLGVGREVNRLLNEQGEYQVWLEYYGYDFNEADRLSLKRKMPINQRLASSQYIRLTTRDINPWRLLIIRFRRMLMLLIAVADEEYYTLTLRMFDQYAAPVFGYFAWLFFLPRLLTNLILLGYHVIEHPWMGKEEKALGWKTRLYCQLERRWSEIANDLAWLSNGILICFVFLGPSWQIATMYLALGMQCYDFILSCIRANIEYQRLSSLKQFYKIAYEEAQLASDAQAIAAHLQDLKKRIALENKALCLNVVNFGLLLLGISFSLTYFAAASPILPMVGAIIAVAVTMINYLGVQMLDRERQRLYNVKLPAPPRRKLDVSEHGESHSVSTCKKLNADLNVSYSKLILFQSRNDLSRYNQGSMPNLGFP